MKTYFYRGLSFIFIFVFAYLTSQEREYNKDYFVFLDAKTYDIKILKKDSLIFTNGLTNPQPITKQNIPNSLENYNYSLIANNKNYFVDDGCGIVLEYNPKNNTIKRIDNSFSHKNQFLASAFTYNNKIFLFAGYGLFTYKNILTRYDFKLKEWFIDEYASNEAPEPRSAYSHILIDHYLYVFGGMKKNDEIINGKSDSVEDILWQLDLNTKKWKKLGNVNLDKTLFSSYHYFRNHFTVGKKIYFTRENTLAEIDIPANKVIYYEIESVIFPNNNIVYNPKNKTINFIDAKTSNSAPKFISIPLADLTKKPIDNSLFYIKPIYYKLFTAGAFALIILTIGLIRFFVKRKTKKKKKVLHQTINLFITIAIPIIFIIMIILLTT